MSFLTSKSRKPLTQKQIDAFTKVFAFLAFTLLPALAQAYMGEQVIGFAKTYIVAPMAVIMIIITIGAAMFKPEAAKQAGYVALVAVVLFLLMAQAGNLMNLMANEGR